MVELILAGVIIGAVMAAAAVSGVHDRRRRKAERVVRQRTGAKRPGAPPSGEPIPSGWTAPGKRGGEEPEEAVERGGPQARRS